MSPLRGAKRIVKKGSRELRTSAGTGGVAEGAGGQAPALGRCAYRRRPMLREGELDQVWPSERGWIGSAAIGDGMDGSVAFDGAAEALFIFGDHLEAFRRHPSDRRQLVGRREDAMHARDAAETELIGDMRNDAVTPEQIPDLSFLQAVNRTPMIDVTTPAGSATRIGAMRLESRIARARR